ncbi:MAG: choice-of-anchor B family protein [Saprospiraceae bacterium]|nr:choice-of-anchor B family protein [Saprospiraceae bacterium]
MKRQIYRLSIIGIFGLFLFATNIFAQSPTVNMRLRSRLVLGGQDAANICGYAANNREYALIGTSGGSMIVDVTNPDVPKLIRTIPAVASAWREIKVYRNYAYITTEGSGQGLQILDLSRLPDSAGVQVKVFKSDSVRGLLNLNRTHALHIDTTKGFCYLFGGSGHTLSSGVNVNGATVLDLKDPWNPQYAGYYSQKYIHDGYVENDTLYACHINNGQMSIIDFRDKFSPVTLSTVTTPTAATHNSWLTNDHKTVLTTDENCASYLASYDITNPQQPKLVDKIRSVSQADAIVHNTHILNDYAVTAWYTEGAIITDVHRAQNLVHVAQYDSYAQNFSNYEGAWGVYPFLPSGNILISNITQGELFVVTPQYKRAAYLEGTVTDAATGQPLSGVRVKINSTDMDKRAESSITGGYATGQVTAGSFTVTYSKKGYAPQTVTVNLATAQVVTQNISMRAARFFSASGTITAVGGGAPLADVQVVFKNDYEEIVAKTTVQGTYSTSLSEGDYDVYVGEWGFSSKYLGKQSIFSNVSNISTTLQRNFQDDFWGDLGWTVTGNATAGAWTRGVSAAAVLNEAFTQPNGDSPTDNDNLCFFTGNGTCNAGAGSGDVDGGATILTSKAMKLSTFIDPQLTFNYWFYNGGGNATANDTFAVILSNGLRDSSILIVRQSASTWRQSPALKLKNFLPLTDSMTVAFRVGDADPGHLVEGAIDNFRLTDAAVSNGVQNIAPNWTLKAYPNPFNTALTVDFQLDKTVKYASLKVINALGQVVETQNLKITEGSVALGLGLEKGVYFVKIEAEGKASKVVRVVKQ